MSLLWWIVHDKLGISLKRFWIGICWNVQERSAMMEGPIGFFYLWVESMVCFWHIPRVARIEDLYILSYPIHLLRICDQSHTHIVFSFYITQNKWCTMILIWSHKHWLLSRTFRFASRLYDYSRRSSIKRTELGWHHSYKTNSGSLLPVDLRWLACLYL